MDLEGLTEKKARLGTVYYENNLGEIIAKVCRECFEAKSLESYMIAKKGFCGRESKCKSCKKERMLKYSEENREKVIESKRMWRENNKEYNRSYYDRNKENARKYYEANRERISMYRESNKERRNEFSRKWHRENKERSAETGRIWRETNKERKRETDRNWRLNNLNRATVRTQRYRTRKKELLNDLKSDQYALTLEYLGNSCALTGRTSNLSMDHAIPVSTGHAGTTFGNCYPLLKPLNSSKNDRNIFEWFEANRQRFNLEQWRFDRLIDWLGKANGMTVEEYRAYVYECHANPNEIDDAEAN